MADFLSKALGNEGIASMVGDKAGELVEETVKKVLSGAGEKKEEEKEGSGFNPANLLSLGDGNKDDNNGGFNVGDAISLVSGGKNEEGGGGGGGLDVQNIVGGLFK